MKIERHGSALWYGGFLSGSGIEFSDHGALGDHCYSSASYFDRLVGSNAEQLLAAAHAACFNMVLAIVLAESKLVATELRTKATVKMDAYRDETVITSIHLKLVARAPGASAADFRRFAEIARAKCPLTRLLNVDVTCQVPCDHISQRVWRLSAARDAMKQLYQHLGT